MMSKRGLYGLMLVFVMLTVMGCSTSKTDIKETLTPSTEVASEEVVPTPEDQMERAKSRVEEEMRIFDVGAHHDTLKAKISMIDNSLTDVEIKAEISEIVKAYMDDYFLEKTREILYEYNKDYGESDVATLFESTSRTSLYTLIELFEWSFYENTR